MLIATGGTPAYSAGPLDVVLVLRDVNSDRYHLAFFEHHPMPGPIVQYGELEVVRLKSKMHHTEGAETLEGALKVMDEFLTQSVHVFDGNAFRGGAIEWDGEIGIVCIASNWRRRGAERPFNPTETSMNLGPAITST